MELSLLNPFYIYINYYMLRFNRVDLGNIPPRIEGVKLYSVDFNRIILDLDIFYEGDLRYLNPQ